ncbi:hypothetical protein O1M63_26615 [Streptomyces mirabilis]|nr:hypothetical protein [Streptomyces mirabilis]
MPEPVADGDDEGVAGRMLELSLTAFRPSASATRTMQLLAVSAGETLGAVREGVAAGQSVSGSLRAASSWRRTDVVGEQRGQRERHGGRDDQCAGPRT